MLDYDQESLVNLDCVAGREMLILIGHEGLLPWADGVTYLGRDPRAPSLLVPTTLTPSVHIALLERALMARFSNTSPLAVLPDACHVVPLSAARPLELGPLRAWLVDMREERD